MSQDGCTGMVVRVEVISSEAEAASELRSMEVSRAGVEIMAPKGVFRAVRIYDVPIVAATIIKQEMLSKGGDAALPRAAASLSVDACDVLLMGTMRVFRRAIETLKMQPFGLAGIARDVEVALDNFDAAPEPMRIGGKDFRWGTRTYVMGILNMTPDSFSDAGAYFNADAAVEHAKEMLAAGADIIDIGGESSRPGAPPLPLKDELERVLPVVGRIASETDAVISIDTYKAEVARRCLDAGAHIINDITAFRGEGDMASVVSQYRAPIVLMHMMGRPVDMQANPTYECVIREVFEFLKERISYAEDHGVPACNTIVDPGIGFGKTAEHNLEIMRRLAEFRSLGRPILVGTSRKSTIGKVIGKPVDERVYGTAATVALTVAGGADIVRVHDVNEMAMVARMSDAIIRGWREEGDGNVS